MPGLLAYAAAGALAGWGEGLEERALAKLQAQYKAEDRAERLEDQKEIIDYKQQLKAGGAGGQVSGSSTGGGTKVSGKATSNARPTRNEGKGGSKSQGRLTYVRTREDGTRVGINAEGREVPVLDDSGNPVRDLPEGPDVASSAPAAPANPAGGAPAKGAVVGGYRFMGGDPNDEKNWQRTSNAQ
jgi:hypothetical protein